MRYLQRVSDYMTVARSLTVVAVAVGLGAFSNGGDPLIWVSSPLLWGGTVALVARLAPRIRSRWRVDRSRRAERGAAVRAMACPTCGHRIDGRYVLAELGRWNKKGVRVDNKRPIRLAIVRFIITLFGGWFVIAALASAGDGIPASSEHDAEIDGEIDAWLGNGWGVALLACSIAMPILTAAIKRFRSYPGLAAFCRLDGTRFHWIYREPPLAPSVERPSIWAEAKPVIDRMDADAAARAEELRVRMNQIAQAGGNQFHQQRSQHK